MSSVIELKKVQLGKADDLTCIADRSEIVNVDHIEVEKVDGEDDSPVSPMSLVDGNFTRTGSAISLSRSKSLTELVFTSFDAGSIRSGIYIMAASAFGAGILVIPWAFSKIGILPAIFMIILIGLINYVSLD